MTPQVPRMENGDSMLNRYFDCGQVRPQVQAVNSTRTGTSVSTNRSGRRQTRAPSTISSGAVASRQPASSAR